MEECEYEAYLKEYFGLKNINPNQAVKVYMGTLADLLCGFHQKIVSELPTDKEITRLSFKKYPGQYPSHIINRQIFKSACNDLVKLIKNKL